MCYNGKDHSCTIYAVSKLSGYFLPKWIGTVHRILLSKVKVKCDCPGIILLRIQKQDAEAELLR